MTIKTVAIFGAGAVGSYCIYGLSKCDIQLSVIAKDERNERLKKNGCLINNIIYHPEVLTPEEAHGVDLLIVCLKYNALQDALEDIQQIIGNQIGMQHMIYSLIKVASHKEDLGYVFDPETTIGIVLEENEEIDELFSRSNLHYRMTSYIQEEIWSKFRLNVTKNLPQAILGAGVGCYSDSDHVKAIQSGLKEELETIAKAKGIDMSKADPSATRGSAVPKTARYSTLQDLDAKRHTEIDMFSGAIIKMGKELNIPTPYNEFVYHIIKAMEEKNDGLFDYK